MPTNDVAFHEIRADGGIAAIQRRVAIERPLSVEYNGLAYAVMMVSPSDIEDFAFGFSASERLIDAAADIVDLAIHDTDAATIVRVTLAERLAERVVERVRHRVAETSCGLCGIENLEQAMRPLPRVEAQGRADAAAVFRALGAMRGRQPLNQATGAVHAAMACDADGAIRLAREDVGRHNAFDKLIGAMLRQGLAWSGGFALLSSRCSYELVEKAALARCPMLVTVSAPTSLALARAAEAGLRLVSLARSDSILEAGR